MATVKLYYKDDEKKRGRSKLTDIDLEEVTTLPEAVHALSRIMRHDLGGGERILCRAIISVED